MFNVQPGSPEALQIVIGFLVLFAPLAFWVWRKYAEMMDDKGLQYEPRKSRRERMRERAYYQALTMPGFLAINKVVTPASVQPAGRSTVKRWVSIVGIALLLGIVITFI